MVAFFKRYIAEHMDNTESLSDGAYRVHDITEELIMLNEGPISDNERGIAGRCNMRPDRYRAYRDELVQAGKIRIVDGKISIERCIDALEKIEHNRMNAGEGGKQSGKTRRKLSNRDGLDEVSMTSRSGLDEVSMTSREVSNTSRVGLDEVSNAKPLKTNVAGEAPLQRDRSLKDSLRLSKTQSTSLRSVEARRGTRLRTDWAPDEREILYAKSKGLRDDDLRNEIQKFRNYWHSKAGKDAAKMDWGKTFENWILSWAERKNGNRANKNNRATDGTNARQSDAVMAGLANRYEQLFGNESSDRPDNGRVGGVLDLERRIVTGPEPAPDRGDPPRATRRAA